MGTAKSHPGPSTPEWKKARRKLKGLARSGPSDQNTLASVVAAAATALKTGGDGLLGTGGPEASQRLGGMLSGFGSDGVVPTLERLDLGHLVGLNGIDLLIALVDYVTGDSSDLEQAAIRQATDAVIKEMVGDDGQLPDGVWNEEQVCHLLERFWSGYIAAIILQALSKALLDAAPGEDAARLEGEIRDHVAALLEHHLDGKDVLSIDWSGQAGVEITEQIRKDVLDVLAGDE